MSSNQTRQITFYVLLITLVAFLLRVFRLDFFSLRGDEAFTVIFVQRTWDGLWRGIRFIEPNPPLMYLALRAWIALAGAGEFATRYFSAFFGVLCVPLLYRLALVTFAPTAWAQRGVARSASDEAISPTVSESSRPFRAWEAQRAKQSPTPSPAKRGRVGVEVWTALFAAALIAINPYQIWHSQDVRNYTMWPALSLASLIFFWQWWSAESAQPTTDGSRKFTLHVLRFTFDSLRFTFRSSRLTPLVLYILFALASLYTHYYDIFILAAENLFVVVFALGARRWKTLGRWIGAQVVLVLAYAPWVVFGTNRITTYGEASAESGVSLLDQFSRTIATFTLSDTVTGDLHTFVWIPLALALMATLFYLAQNHRAQLVFLSLYIAMPTVMLYVISIGRPLFNERYLNAIAPAYYLVFASGLAALWPPRRSWHVPTFYVAALFFALVSALALANYWYDPAFAKAPDWRGLSRQINSDLRAGDIIVQNFNEMSAQYYRQGDAPVITVPRDYWYRPEDVKTLEKLNQDYRRIWFIPAQPDWWDPDADVSKYLSRYDDLEQERQLSVFHLQLYATPREFESRMTSVGAQVGAATLAGYRVDKGANRVRVVLYWRGLQKTESNMHVFVHLADASDRVVAQDDSVPVQGTYPTTEWQAGELIVDTHSFKTDSSGIFTLLAGMYDPSTNVRAPAFDIKGARLSQDRITLTSITLP